MMRKKVNFIKLLRMWGIVFLVGLGASLIVLDIVTSYHDLNFRANQMRTDYIDRQKQIIKEEVKRVVDRILYEKTQRDELTRKKIKTRVYEAYSIAENIYQENKTAKSDHEIQQMILDALRPIRFENGTGYYFAVSMDGVEQLYPVQPELEGKNLIGLQDYNGNFVIQDEINVINKSGEGFVIDFWPKPGKDPAVAYQKISFVKYFKPLDWYFGTGLYVDDVENQIKADLLSTISRIRFGTEGYIFVNRLNGDALVSNEKLFSGEKKLWEVFNKNPEKMKNIFEKEYNAALKPEGDYIYYTHIKLTDPKKVARKVSFIYGVPEWQWLVGAGVYLDDVETDIAQRQAELNNQIKMRTLYSTLITVGLVAILLLLSSRLNRRLKNDFNLFVSFFNKVALFDEPIDRDKVRFDELDRMAENANKMLADRRQAVKEQRENEQQLLSIYETVGDVIFLLKIEDDGQYRFVSANQAFFNVTGLRQEMVVGKTVNEVIPEPSLTMVLGKYRQAMEENHIVRWEESSDYPTGRLTGEVSVAPVFDDQGKCTHLVGSLHDITERKQAEKEKEKLEDQLKQSQKMEAIGTLAGGVAHDLNNVLSGILSYPDLLLMDIPQDSPLRKPILTIKQSGEKAAAIVQDLLTLARRGVVIEEITNLNIIISEYLKSPEYKKVKSYHPKVQIETNLETKLLNILGSPVHLTKSVMNLVSNAAEAMPDGGKILISTENRYIDIPIGKYEKVEEGDYAVLKVQDDGMGIVQDNLNKIFEPFFTKKAMGRSGTGLGMAVVWGTVKDHNGYIDVQSIEGKGTTLTLYFPVTRKDKEEEKPQLSIENLIGKKESVLVVDDREEQREIASDMLQKLNYSVVSVASGEEAIDYLKDNAVDLLLLDMIMNPGIDGLETYRQILKLHPTQKAIVASGFSETVRVKEVQKLGAKKYIKKPYTIKNIGLAVKEELEKH